MIRIIGKTAARKICFDGLVGKEWDRRFGTNVIACVKCHLHLDLRTITLENFEDVVKHAAEHNEELTPEELGKIKAWLGK